MGDTKPGEHDLESDGGPLGPQPGTAPRDAGRPVLEASVALVAFALLAAELFYTAFFKAEAPSMSGADRFLYDASGDNYVVGLLLCGWLVWRRGPRIAALWRSGETSRGAMRLGAALLLIGIALQGWSAHTGAIDLQVPAIAAWMSGAGILLAGRAGGRAMILPVSVLLFSMPVSAGVVNAVLYPMQIMTANGVSNLLDLLGIRHDLYGVQLYTASHAFYVIEGCAGLRTLQTIGLACCFYLELMFRDRRQAILLGLAVPFLSVAVNQLRVLVIVLLPDSALAADHTQQGLAMIVLGVVVIGVIDALHERFDRRGEGAPPLSEDSPSSVRTGRVGIGVHCVLWAVLAQVLAGWLVPRYELPEPSVPRAALLSQEIDGWRAIRSLVPDRQFLGSVRGSDHVHRVFRPDAVELSFPPEARIELLLLVDDHRARNQNLLSRKSALANPGSRVFDEQTVPLRGLHPQMFRQISPQRRVEVLHTFAGTGSMGCEITRSLLALDQAHSHRVSPTLSIRVSIEGVSAAEGARQALTSFTESLIDQLELGGWLGPQSGC